MSAHVLLNLLNELMRGFPPTSSINSIIQEHECKILFITLKSHLIRSSCIKTLSFRHKKTRHFYGRQRITLPGKDIYDYGGESP